MALIQMTARLLHKILSVLLVFLVGCAPALPFIHHNYGPVNNDYTWNKEYDFSDNPSVIIKFQDIDKDNSFSYGDKVIWYVDFNKNNQLDLYARFTILGGNQSRYFSSRYPFEVKLDTNHDKYFDRLIRYDEVTGEIIENIKIHSMVYPIFFDYSEARGFSLYGLDKFLPFIIIIAAFAVIFKTDTREAR